MKGTWRARLSKHLAAHSRRDEAERIMHRAETVAEQNNDYFVLVKRCGRRGRRRWAWEIKRRSKALNTKFEGNEYATPQEAKLAGEKKLKELTATKQ